MMDELITDLVEIQRLAKAQDGENIRFRQFIRYRLKWSDRKLDGVVQQIARAVQTEIDCTQCANCCRGLEVSLNERDLQRLATHLGVPVGKVEAQYARRGVKCDLAFSHSPCVFLQDSRCSVYAARPADCREYPHLDKKDFRERMWFLLDHVEDCPIVFHTLDRLKRYFRDHEEQ